MRLHFLTMPLLASTCMFAPDNLRSFAPMFRDFGLNPKKTSHNMNETKKTEKEKEGELSNIGSPCCQESKAKEEKVKKTEKDSKTIGEEAADHSSQTAEGKDPRQREQLQKTTDHRLHIHTREGKATGEKERRRRRRRRSKERQRRRRRKRHESHEHEKKRQRLNNKEKGRTRLNKNKEKGKRLNKNNNNNNKKKGTTRKIPLCLVRCLTANMIHPAHCHVLCS